MIFYTIVLGGIAFAIYLFLSGEERSLWSSNHKLPGNTLSNVQNYQALWGLKRDSAFAMGSGEDSDDKVSNRRENYELVTNTYYDLATDFYEYGWGRHFHFAPRYIGESLNESLKRHEHWLAMQLNLKPGERVLDLGCGVGGPMMEIATFTGSLIVGVNNNEYQVQRGRVLVERAGLGDKCSFVKADFNKLPFEDNSVDAIYSIEAFCHAPDKVRVFKECFRVLKPGGRLGCYDWMMCKSYDDKNPKHVACKKGVELGNGIADLPLHPDEFVAAFKEAGFKVEKVEDRLDTFRPGYDLPWYDPLSGRFTLRNFRTTKVGQMISHTFVTLLEKVKLAPAGSVETHKVLLEAAQRLVEGGENDIFTPMLYVHAIKE